MRSHDLTRLSVDIAHRIARGEPYEHDLADGLVPLFAADAGIAVGRFSFRAEMPTSFTISGGTALTEAQMQRYREVAPLHPGWRSDHRLGARPTVRLSDLMNLRRFWGTEPYQVIHAPDHGRYPASAILCSTPHELVFLALQRRRRDFTDTEMAELAAVQELLAAAYAFRTVLDQAVVRLRRGAVTAPAGWPSVPQLAPDEDSHYTPTKREAEVLALAAVGFTNRRIANQLNITERTVRKHLGNVYEQTRTSGRAAAAAWWQRRQP